jgi:hypothetical protein
MFRISVTVDDNDLGQVIKVLHQLKDVIVNIEPPQPVAAVRPKGEIAPSSNLYEHVANTLRSSKSESIRTDAIRDMIVEAGGSKNSISYCLRKLSQIKVLKPTKRRGHYIVNQS